MQKQMSKVMQAIQPFEGRPITSDVLSAMVQSVQDCLWGGGVQAAKDAENAPWARGIDAA